MRSGVTFQNINVKFQPDMSNFTAETNHAPYWTDLLCLTAYQPEWVI